MGERRVTNEECFKDIIEFRNLDIPYLIIIHFMFYRRALYFPPLHIYFQVIRFPIPENCLGMDAQTGMAYISGVFEGTPAEEAGLRDGDVIYMVNQQSMQGLDV